MFESNWRYHFVSPVSPPEIDGLMVRKPTEVVLKSNYRDKFMDSNLIYDLNKLVNK